MREDLIRWEYHLDNPNTSVNPKNFRSTLILPPVYSGEVSHHMHDSVETYDSLICHSTNMTCPSICQPHQPSDHHTIDTNSLSICQPHESPVHHTTMATSPSVCQTYIPPVCHNIMMTSPSDCQSYITSDHRTGFTTSLLVCQSCQSSVRR